MKLPQNISLELKKRRHLILCKNLIKSAVFWGVSMTVLFVIGSRSKLFNMQTQPVWFWGVFAILLALPVLYFKFYQLATYPEVTGMVSKLESKTHDIRGVADNMNRPELGRFEVCEVTVLDEKGKTHVFPFPRTNQTAFAGEYYQVGDVVYYPRFAKCPFNESRLPPRPFCLCCGHIGAAGEHHCPDCGAPFVPDRMEEKKKQDAWEYRNGF